jgi:hypothetical protein
MHVCRHTWGTVVREKQEDFVIGARLYDLRFSIVVKSRGKAQY